MSQKERLDIPLGVRYLTLLTFLAASFFFNVDGGVFAPAVLMI